MRQLETAGVQLLLRTELVRAALCRVGPQYRAFFSFLLRVVRALEYESAQGGAAAQSWLRPPYPPGSRASALTCRSAPHPPPLAPPPS